MRNPKGLRPALNSATAGKSKGKRRNMTTTQQPVPHKVWRIAEHLLLARKSGSLHATPENGPRSTTEAYEIQAMTAERLGPVGGFKAGRKQVGDAPNMAPIQQADIQPTGALVYLDTHRKLGVELEIGFVLLADPPNPDASDFLSRLRAAVAALPALEVVESRLADVDVAGPLWKLADNQMNGGIVLGTPVSDWSNCNMRAPNAALMIGGNSVWDGPAPVPGGDAFGTLAAFVGAVGSHCRGLKKGHVVITGSIAGLHSVGAGQKVCGEIAGFGLVSAQFG